MSLIPAFLLDQNLGGENVIGPPPNSSFTLFSAVAMLLASFEFIYQRHLDFASLAGSERLDFSRAISLVACGNLFWTRGEGATLSFHTWLPDAYEAAPPVSGS